MSIDRLCDIQFPKGGWASCELSEGHDGDHYCFNNTVEGLTWPQKLSDESRREIESVLREIHDLGGEG